MGRAPTMDGSWWPGTCLNTPVAGLVPCGVLVERASGPASVETQTAATAVAEAW